MLPLKFTPALLTVDSLQQQSSLRRKHIEQDCRGSGDKEVDLEVWRQTLEECDQGWLKGPIKLHDIPETAPVSRRFGLRQRHKARLIDDFSESNVNQAVTVLETPIHGGHCSCHSYFLDEEVQRDGQVSAASSAHFRFGKRLQTSGPEQPWT